MVDPTYRALTGMIDAPTRRPDGRPLPEQEVATPSLAALLSAMKTLKSPEKQNIPFTTPAISCTIMTLVQKLSESAGYELV